MRLFLLILILTFGIVAEAQVLSNLRHQTLSVESDSIMFDSLSIIPGTFILTDSSGNAINPSLYQFIPEKALIIVSDSLKGRQLSLSYRVFPINLTAAYYNKDIRMIEPDEKRYYNPFDNAYSGNKNNIFDFGGLNKSGSISRGISFGNKQDVVVNSNLNLQLSGKLSEDVTILAAVTDNNIPVQPDGNTQQIQDFDKVFIQLSAKKSKLIAGDFELLKPESYFMNFYKKAQGATYKTSFSVENKQKKEAKMNLLTAAAISKGKYAKNTLAGIEGNQGPYRLNGNENEAFIIVLSGSEKVYIDGILMQRGQNEDYIINYNTAEITFTGKRMITKDSRIIVEFQYSDKNYARSLLFFSNELVLSKATIRMNYFSEQDLKNQPLQQDLSPQKKQLLQEIGDSLQNAFFLNIDSIPFNSNEVLYKLTDTTVLSVYYDSVFVYSANPDSAFYRLSFSNVGQGNGNYIQIQSSANGRVFKWVAPVANEKQGSYEPVILLITPKKKQMLTVSGDFTLSKRTNAGIEAAFSNNNLNLFSDKDKKDDAGVAISTYVKNTIPFLKKDSTGWTLVSELTNEFSGKNFSPVERYRDAEFNRDWNTGNTKLKSNENISGIKLFASDKHQNNVGYQLKMFVNDNDYNAFRHSTQFNFAKKGFTVNFIGSYLNTSDFLNKTRYLRGKAGISKKLPFLTLGIKGEQEDNRLFVKGSSDMNASSFAFTEWQAFAEKNDTTNINFNVFFKERKDKLPYNNSLNNASTGRSAGITFELLKKANNHLSINSTYRTLYIDNAALTTQKKDQSLLTLVEHSLKLLKGVLTAKTYYEIGSGLEAKKEYSYLEVAAGQGVYTWTDYNQNGIKELNEFDIAVFQDQASYIRVYIPTNQYVKAYTNQLNESLILNPAIIWTNKKGFRKFASRFSNQTTYRINRKDTRSNALEALNPFVTNVNDTNLISVNSSLRNSIFFNRSSSVFGADFIYSASNNKQLMINGFESRMTKSYAFNIRWNISSMFTFTSKYTQGTKTNTSGYFSNRDYNIVYSETEPTLSWQPDRAFRVNISYNYAEKKNAAGTINEQCFNNKAGIELKYSQVSKGTLLFKYNLINNKFSELTTSAISYEMLDGLKTGKNSTWNIAYQRNIAEYLQLNLIYEGRKSENVKTVHIANVQLRAYF